MGLVVMEKQNVTLSLPMGLLKKAKFWPWRGESLSTKW